MQKLCVTYLLSFLCIPFFMLAQGKTVLSFVVSSGDFDRQNNPVSISLAGTGLSTTRVHYQLVEISKKGEILTPFQLDQAQVYWILAGNTPAGSRRLFELRQIEGLAKEKPQELMAKREDGAILFQQFGKDILCYQYKEEEAPEGASKLYRRGGFIH
ncbi:MAG: hypothetical protein AAFO82_19870, partial [Bacteroidota bacterium]